MSSTIVFNGRFLAQAQTGVQRYAVETLKAIDLILRDDTQFRGIDLVLAVPNGARELNLRTIATKHVQGSPSHFWEQTQLARFAFGKYLVNFSYSGPLLKRKQLVTIHDATVKAMPECFDWKYRATCNFLAKRLGRVAESVMTVSCFSKFEIMRHYGIAESKIIVGREGGEHLVSSLSDEDVLKKHNLSSGEYLLGVGSIKPNKNYRLVGEAIKLIPDYPLTIAIAGASDLGIFSSESTILGNVRLLGYVPDEDLPALYRHAKWFVFPSIYEGFGLPAIEAMANGCPVIAASSASIPEVCGDAALYFDPSCPTSLANQLRNAVTDDSKRDELIAAGRKRLEIYNWDANARILLDHLRRVV